MKLTRVRGRAVAFLMALAFAASAQMPFAGAGSVGISTRFVDVTVDNLRPGTPARISDLGHPRYTLQNRGAAPTEVAIAVAAPSFTETAAGFEPIPDVTWIRVEHDRMKLSPGELRSTDLILSVPNHPVLWGKKFHAKILARTMGENQLVSAAVASHLKIVLPPAPKSRPKRKPSK